MLISSHLDEVDGGIQQTTSHPKRTMLTFDLRGVLGLAWWLADCKHTINVCGMKKKKTARGSVSHFPLPQASGRG